MQETVQEKKTYMATLLIGVLIWFGFRANILSAYAAIPIPQSNSVPQSNPAISTTTFWSSSNKEISPAAVQNIASVRIANSEIADGDSATLVPIQIENVEGLGAVTVLVGYDPNVLEPVACQRNNVFDVGLCSIEYDRDDDGQADAVRFNVVSLTGQRAAQNEPLTLSTISWNAMPVTTVGSTTELTVNVLTFTDTDAIPMDVMTQNAQVTIVEAEPEPEVETQQGAVLYLPLMQNRRTDQ